MKLVLLQVVVSRVAHEPMTLKHIGTMSNPLRENTRDTCEPPAWDVNMCENHMCRSTFPEKTRKYVQGKSAISAGDVQQSAAEDLFIFTGTIRQPLFFPLWRCFLRTQHMCCLCTSGGRNSTLGPEIWGSSAPSGLLPGSFRAPSGVWGELGPRSPAPGTPIREALRF